MACIFFALYLHSVKHLTQAYIAARINLHSGRWEMSYQHISFYFLRLLYNRPLITGFFGSRGIVFSDRSDDILWLKEFIQEARRLNLQWFSLLYFNFQARHFFKLDPVLRFSVFMPFSGLFLVFGANLKHQSGYLPSKKLIPGGK